MYVSHRRRGPCAPSVANLMRSAASRMRIGGRRRPTHWPGSSRFWARRLRRAAGPGLLLPHHGKNPIGRRRSQLLRHHPGTTRMQVNYEPRRANAREHAAEAGRRAGGSADFHDVAARSDVAAGSGLPNDDIVAAPVVPGQAGFAEEAPAACSPAPPTRAAPGFGGSGAFASGGVRRRRLLVPWNERCADGTGSAPDGQHA